LTVALLAQDFFFFSLSCLHLPLMLLAAPEVVGDIELLTYRLFRYNCRFDG
jgi:hypothetical protein